jgi:hypothetical protein
MAMCGRHSAYVIGAGVAGHSVFLLREIHVGPRER